MSNDTVNINVSNVLLVESKLDEGCKGYAVGTADFKFKANSILDDLINDGIVTSYDWLSPIDININVVGDIKEISIRGTFH